MQVFSLLPLLASVLAASGASAVALIGSGSTAACAKETIAYETFIGEGNDVKVQYSHCDDAPRFASNGKVVGLDKRQSNSTNVCGAPCKTRLIPTLLWRFRF